MKIKTKVRGGAGGTRGCGGGGGGSLPDETVFV